MPVETVRSTTAQALVRFPAAQRTERDGVEHRLIPGVRGIFGHGNVAGLGQALLRAAHENRAPADLPYRPAREPVLQQLEVPRAGDVGVNDAFRPVSKRSARISRPEQLIPAALAAMRVLARKANGSVNREKARLKQMDPEILRQVRDEGLGFGEAVKRGVCVEPPAGVPNPADIVAELVKLDAELFVIVEQDLYPCDPDVPLPVAVRTREYLGGCGLGAHRQQA